MSAVSTMVCAVTMASRVSNRDFVSSFMSVPLADGGVGAAIVSREWAGAPVSSSRAKVARSYERGAGCPLAFGLAGFFFSDVLAHAKNFFLRKPRNTTQHGCE